MQGETQASSKCTPGRPVTVEDGRTTKAKPLAARASSMDAQGGQLCGAPEEEEEEEEDESLITEILTAAPPKLVDTSVACLISWAGDDIDRGDYYEPGVVRIGPFHRQDRSKRSADRMEQKKKLVLQGLLTARSSSSKEEDDEAAGGREELRSHLKAMGAIVDHARGYFNRRFRWMNDKEFARMLLLDGCFLYSRFFPGGGMEDITVDRDIIFLLENQIPFFVLEKIHQQLIKSARVQDTTTSTPRVLDKVAKRVQRLLQRNNYIISNVNVPSSPPPTPPCHLLHLLYMYFTPAGRPAAGSIGNGWCICVDNPPIQGQPNNSSSSNNNSSSSSSNSTSVPLQVRWRTATQYYGAGVGFVKRKLGGSDDDDGARSILDVDLTVGWLTGGTLHVPCLMVDTNTFRMLRNMVSLEQKSLQRSSHVTAYCLFLSQVAGTKEDVELLVSKGVISHLLSSVDDVARGLAGLCDGVVLDADDPELNYLSSKHKALEPLYHSSWGRSVAWLWNVKCDNPLKAMAFLAAVVVSIANVLQLVFAGLSYGRGK